MLGAGAQQIIAGSALFKDGRPDLGFAKALADAVGVDRVIAAVDSRGGRVVIHGWKTPLPLTAVEAVRALEPYCGEFLYTHVDTEGLMGGTNLDAILAVRRATTAASPPPAASRRRQEIDDLDARGVDAVVGMAIYTGTTRSSRRSRRRSPNVRLQTLDTIGSWPDLSLLIERRGLPDWCQASCA